MPYGRDSYCFGIQAAWSFNPSYGLHALRAFDCLQPTFDVDLVSIPHMGCMPYGLAFGLNMVVILSTSFNPSYGLHALRASHGCPVSFSRISFNTSYGLHALRADNWFVVAKDFLEFQSLIWVACPTGGTLFLIVRSRLQFQSLIWVACPTGLFSATVKNFTILVSIPHMGCMPYGLNLVIFCKVCVYSFNPSYGLHALRAYSHPTVRCSVHRFQSLIWVACPTGTYGWRSIITCSTVSIPHMGCMPYGQGSSTADRPHRQVSIPHMGCMPYGQNTFTAVVLLFDVSIPHMGCMPYGHIKRRRPASFVGVSIPHMGCMPYGRCLVAYPGDRIPSFNPSYGLHALRAATSAVTILPFESFQSLIWVACPTGIAQ